MQIPSFFLPLSIATLVLGGCASIAGTKQVISVDSSPRGLEILDSKATKSFGKTPLFIELPRGPAVELHDADHRFYKFECGLRWGALFFGNTPLALAPPYGAYYAAGLGIDFVTGAAWECPDNIILHSTKVVKKEEVCRNYLLVPPQHPDEKIALKIMEEWKTRLSPTFNKCDSIVSFDKTLPLLARYNISNSRQFDLEKQKSSISQVGLRTGANTIVYFKYKVVGEKLAIVNQIVDMHNFKEVQKLEYELDIQTDETLQVITDRMNFGSFVRFFPNSFGFGASELEIPTETETAKYSSVSKAKRLPSILSDLRMLSVEHPYQHEVWDFALSVAPTLSTAFVAREMTIARPSPLADDYRFSAFYVTNLMKASATLHTPLGAVSIGPGIGPTYIWFQNNLTDDIHAFRLAAVSEVAYTAFFTENFFFRLSYSQLEPTQPFVRNDYVKLESFTQTSMTLGYFYPEIRSILRNMF